MEIKNNLSEREIWKILKSYFDENTIIDNQIESYNDFITFGLQDIIDRESTIETKNYKINFGQIHLDKPSIIQEDRTIKLLYPSEARQTDLTYDSSLYVDITETKIDEMGKKDIKLHTRVLIAKIPVMLKSCLCNLTELSEEEKIEKGECSKDLGGYFIVKGNERVIVAQMRSVYNQIFVLKQKSESKYKWIAETRSMSDENGHSVSVQAMLKNDERTIEFSIPYIKETIPAGIIFKALNIINEEEIVAIIGLQNEEKSGEFMRSILRDSFFCKTREEALLYIAKHSMHIIDNKKHLDYGKQIVETELLPHLGISGTLKEKACFMGRMIKKLLMTHFGTRKEDDRDSYFNKRIETTGILIHDIFRNLFKKFVVSIKKNLESKIQIPDINSFIAKYKGITKGLHTCMATGNWIAQKNATYVRTGVSQILDRMTYNATLSHLRRIIIPMVKEGKNSAIRQIHSSSFGYVCVTGDTKILLSNQTEKEISKIDENDEVITINIENFKEEKSKIYNIFSLMPKELIEIEAGDNKIKCTLDHPFLVFYKSKFIWIRAGLLRQEMFLSIRKNEKIIVMPIKNIRSIQPELVYDFTTESKNHNFIANNFVTHNCPSETPEGKKVGVVLNFALLPKVTKKISKVDVKRVLENCYSFNSVEDTDIKNMEDHAAIILNGSIIGFSPDPEKTIQEIKLLRLKNLLDKEISVSYDIIDNDIKIFSDEGRVIRPLLTLTNNILNLDKNILNNKNGIWRTLIKKGYIQYVDPSEIENSVIAMTPEYLNTQHNDFLEIHPITMLGIMASLIPFSDHSQSPRNCYQSSMGKQALGIPLLSYNQRTDTTLHVLHYVQRPLVFTKIAELMKINEMPSGINAIVAIASYTGFNQEDSLILNQSSIERGLFTVTTFFTIDAIEKKRDTYSFEEITLPPINSDPNIKQGQLGYFRRKNANYSLLDNNGIIRPREKFHDGKWIGEATRVKKGDVIIGKIIVNGSKSGEESKTDASVVIQPGEEGVIDRVHVLITPNGYKLVKVVIRIVRSPILGDKLASNHGQKGTIGMVYRQEDMPFTSQGITPDIIINPLCMPSRMTINQLIACALGKSCLFTGDYGDATPFTSSSINAADKLIDNAGKILLQHGFRPEGWETLFNGMTGDMLEAKIFIGPTYYQRLKHMVTDKMHARATGAVTALTKQPLEGRAREGGLRFGEMERDVSVAHGTSRFLKERLFEVSDPFQITVCQKCGIVVSNIEECQSCRSNNTRSVNIPYASKLLYTELTALGLKMNFRTEDK